MSAAALLPRCISRGAVLATITEVDLAEALITTGITELDPPREPHACRHFDSMTLVASLSS